ncbi:unnamed protein product, partial [Closterium sp. NIES-54]
SSFPSLTTFHPLVLIPHCRVAHTTTRLVASRCASSKLLRPPSRTTNYRFAASPISTSTLLPLLYRCLPPFPLRLTHLYLSSRAVFRVTGEIGAFSVLASQPHPPSVLSLPPFLTRFPPAFADNNHHGAGWQVKANCAALAERLVALGYTLVSGGTDNHLLLLDLRPLGLDGARVEKVLDLAAITLNKNSVPGDKSAIVPGGIRIGTPALTTRGFKEDHFHQVAELLHEGINLAQRVKVSSDEAVRAAGGAGAKVKDYMAYVQGDACKERADIEALKQRVTALSTQFPMPGVDIDNLAR